MPATPGTPWWTWPVEDALDLVAARAVFAKMAADDASDAAVAQAQAARRSLGVLGVPEGRLNEIVEGVNAGDISRPGAALRLALAGPGRLRQALQVPAATLTAAGQGDLPETLRQADVPGLKNLADPLTGAASLGLAGAGTWAGRNLRDNRDIAKLIAGTHAQAGKSLEDALKQTAGQTTGSRYSGQINAHRAALAGQAQAVANAPKSPILPQSWADAKARAAALGAKAKGVVTDPLGTAKAVGRHAGQAAGWLGPAAGRDIPLQPPGGSPLPGRTMAEALKAVRAAPAGGKGAPAAKGLFGTLAAGKQRFGLPAAGGALGLLALPFAQEWLVPGRGYRSGQPQLQQLLDANRTLREQPPP